MTHSPTNTTAPARSMTIVDDIDAHMARAGQIDRAALLPGVFLAWCVRLQLVDSSFANQHQELILRLNYHEITGAQLLVDACGGTLRYEHLNPRGGEFARAYYPLFIDDWRATFGEDIYSVPDNWETYDRIAPALTSALLGPPGKPPVKAGRWWQFWK